MNFKHMTSTRAVRHYDKRGSAAKRFRGERAGSLLRLMAALEASVEGSRKTLLALDLPELVSRTREQILLSRQLAAVLYEACGDGDALCRAAGLTGEFGSQQVEREQARTIAKRIIAAIRLQYALLARSRTKLRVMANMLAGTSAAYGPI
jgi:hypothetical protein